IPILQNISPGEIQHCENAQDFSKILVTDWLSKYKFKYWDKHSSTSKPVTDREKKKRANKIAATL
ncbi:Clp protease ClpP, partial [bacterium]|nr:Clp protease ClpP [bacterium]